MENKWHHFFDQWKYHEINYRGITFSTKTEENQHNIWGKLNVCSIYHQFLSQVTIVIGIFNACHLLSFVKRIARVRDSMCIINTRNNKNDIFNLKYGKQMKWKYYEINYGCMTCIPLKRRKTLEIFWGIKCF